MIITLTGKLGSGKSEICNILKNNYNFIIYSTGNIHRMIAKEKNLTTMELNELLNKENLNIDNIIDSKTIELAKNINNDDVVFDSRLAFHFIPKSFKVYLTVEDNEAGKRVYFSRKDSVENYKSPEEAMIKLNERKHLEVERFKKLYNVDINNLKNYDFILDTTSITPQKATELILQKAKNHYSIIN